MKDNTRVYYNDRCIHFNLAPAQLTRDEGLNNAWAIEQEDALEHFETHFDAFLLTEIEHLIIRCTADEGIEKLKDLFKLVQAGGGLVLNEQNEYLLIHRLGQWDLPKGKLEKGENISECAVREVEEETGITDIEQGELMDISYHLYVLKDKMIIKETYWYEMRAQKQELQGQLEEGIEKAVWVHANNMAQHIGKSYKSIQHLMRQYL